MFACEQFSSNSSEGTKLVWMAVGTMSKRSLSVTAAVGYKGGDFAVPRRCSTVGIVRQERLAGSECGVHMDWCHPSVCLMPLEAAMSIYVLWQRFPYGWDPIIAKTAFLAWGGFSNWQHFQGTCQDMSHGKLLCSSILKPTPTLFWQKWEMWGLHSIFSVPVGWTLQGSGFIVVVCFNKIFLNNF